MQYAKSSATAGLELVSVIECNTCDCLLSKMSQAFVADQFCLPAQLVDMIIPNSDAPSEQEAEVAAAKEED